MTRLVTLIAAAALSAAPTGPADATPASALDPPPVVRVMPLGDSITYGTGSCDGDGYRGPLLGLVAAQSRYAVDLVGSQQGGTMADPDNEGHPGYTISQIASGVDGWLAAAHPDVVLLHIGINDLLGGTDGATAADLARRLLDRIYADRPGVTVIMQGLIPTTPGWNPKPDQPPIQAIAGYNGRLRQLQPAEQQQGRRFSYVDAPSLDPGTQLPDGVHPDDAGYALLARNFFAPLDQAFSAGWFTGGPARPHPSAPIGTVHLADIRPDGALQNAEGDCAARSWSRWSPTGRDGVTEATSAAAYSIGRWSGCFQAAVPGGHRRLRQVTGRQVRP
ncbi:SGNH/GDSL hydrolase family protein [Kitasatospora viridis]|uniref:Lysophospholipase L1-like esterase n=1 Tax=Kitasatospora viridis TaxID=281105 RepID=A0A561SDI2_9ACTN|nr:SGNH/GDSL hydrolase family protein [Kitasatospora viridis]TWF72931.1 lysophospholipase L1-like esterase [Kitasatospora viridis]